MVFSSCIATGGLTLCALLLPASALAQSVAAQRDELHLLEASGRFDEAAGLLEARRDGGAVAWCEGMRRAVRYRAVLGEYELAREDLRALERCDTDGTAVSEASLEVGAALDREGRWRDSVAHHRAWLRRYASTAAPRQVANALVRLGEALRSAGDARASLEAFERVLLLVGEDGELQEHRAHAAFRIADDRFQTFVTTRPPPRDVNTTRQAYDRWTVRVMSPFLVRIQQEHEVLTRRFVVVIACHSPRWEVLAAERLAASYEALDRFYVSLFVLPPGVRNNPELQEAWCAEQGCPQNPVSTTTSDLGSARATAIEGYAACVRTATAVRWPTRECVDALARLDPRHVRVDDEVVPALLP